MIYLPMALRLSLLGEDVIPGGHPGPVRRRAFMCSYLYLRAHPVLCARPFTLLLTL